MSEPVLVRRSLPERLRYIAEKLRDDPDPTMLLGLALVLDSDADRLDAATPEQQPDPQPREGPVSMLRSAILAEGGDWTRRRAIEATRPFYGGSGCTHERARQLLNRLVDEGLLDRHGPQGYLWTLTVEGERGRSL